MKYIVKCPEIHMLNVEIESETPLKVGEIKEKVSNLMAEGKLDKAELTYSSTLGPETWGVEAR